ncbi:growth/differentiation factor 8-like [Macrosteles quadrilineatus]|uniref:growth/differentiation factor 8-like n=1 Tax=Macrosteles quadrilineatus TaxID=74068 RepID=UPI0023E0C724|nr:growth/differentiation factor 8-like [Macrosteles quadrilineatus]
MQWAPATTLLLLVVFSLLTVHSDGSPNSTSTRGRRRKSRPWTQEELALADAVAGEEYAEDEGTTPAAVGCSACRLREEMKNFSLEAIKEQILSKLGIDQPPNTTGVALPQVPSVLLEKYHKGGLPVPGMMGDEPPLEDEEDDYHARTEKVIAFAQRSNVSHPKLRHTKGRGQDILYFKFSDKITRNRVQRALLWVYVRGAPSGATSTGPSLGGAPVTISVLRVTRGSEGAETPLSNIVSSKVSRQNDSEGSWVSLDVRKLLEYWFKVPSENLGIVLQATGPRDSLGRSLIVTDLQEANGSLVPFLEVYVAENRKHRTKRTLMHDCHENSEETRCCRYPLTVDFEAFGWDWIIAPKKYEANYCSGECPFVFLQKYPHTYVTDMARPPGTPGPCCAPRKMSPISMLYFDPNLNIIYGLLPGMVVDRCGCS